MASRITVLSHHFPSKRQPYLQTFIHDHIKAFEFLTDFDAFLGLPTPYLIPFTKRWKDYKSPPIIDSEWKRINYLSFPEKKKPELVKRSLAKKIIKEFPVDRHPILHIHWLYPCGIAIPLLKKAGYKCILMIHGSDWNKEYQNGILRPYFFDSIKAADMVLVSGPILKDSIIEEVPTTNTITCLYNYIDTQKFSPVTTSEKAQLKVNFNWDEKATHILTVANIRKEKGIDILLDSLNEINENIHLHIIGKIENDSFSHAVFSSVNEIKTQNITVTFHGTKSRDQLVDYYRAADFYTLPSRSEGFNVSLIEALSCGLPSISTKTGGAQLVINEKNGLLVDTEDPGALALTIQEMVLSYKTFDPHLIHDQVANTYSLEQLAKKLKGIYSKLVSKT